MMGIISAKYAVSERGGGWKRLTAVRKRHPGAARVRAMP